MIPTNDISIIASRVQSLEGRLDDNIDKINGRLDLIVDLMQKVTALQEREISNAVQINDLKLSIKETNTTIKEWNAHIHERMDRHYADIKICREGIDATIINIEDGIDAELKEVRTKNAETQAELSKWLNRGIGAWALASVLLLLVQGVGAYLVNGIIESSRETNDRISKVEERILTTERAQTELWKYAQEKHQVDFMKKVPQ